MWIPRAPSLRVVWACCPVFPAPRRPLVGWCPAEALWRRASGSMVSTTAAAPFPAAILLFACASRSVHSPHPHPSPPAGSPIPLPGATQSLASSLSASVCPLHPRRPSPPASSLSAGFVPLRPRRPCPSTSALSARVVPLRLLRPSPLASPLSALVAPLRSRRPSPRRPSPPASRLSARVVPPTGLSECLPPPRPRRQRPRRRRSTKWACRRRRRTGRRPTPSHPRLRGPLHPRHRRLHSTCSLPPRCPPRQGSPRHLAAPAGRTAELWKRRRLSRPFVARRARRR